MNSNEIANLLVENGIKPSYQRIQIYKYLYEKRNHPTVENIYNVLIKDIPTLSKTTVYNTLNLFIEANIVSAVSLDENEKRHEIIEHDHSHFKCEICDGLYDIPYDDLKLLPDNYKNFRIKEKHIFLKGICESCLKKDEK